MQASNSDRGRNGVDETLGFFEKLDASVLAEMADIAELHFPGFSGCRIGARTTILRDHETGQFLVTCDGGEADVRNFHESPVHGLFCGRSVWLHSWVEARYRDRLARFACKTGTELIAFKDSPERAAVWIAARLGKTEVATQASARVAALMAIPSDALSLAQRLRHGEDSKSDAIRFGDVSLVFRAGPVLERLSLEHPKWVAFVAARMRAGLLSTQIDAMAQLKRLAHSGGASHAAWARLSANGPSDFVALVRANPHLPRPRMDLLEEEWATVLDLAKARHWIGRVWCDLHPELQEAAVTVVLAHPGSLDLLAPLFRALGIEAKRRSEAFHGLAQLENEFRELMAALFSFVVKRHDGPSPSILRRQLQMPYQSRWADWVRWGHRWKQRWASSFWVPLATYSNDGFVAEALLTRADIEREERQMANHIAHYAMSCFSGNYALYRISDPEGMPVATYGAIIETEQTPDGRTRAVRVSMGDLCGPRLGAVDAPIKVFAARLTAQIRLRLPCEVIEPSW